MLKKAGIALVVSTLFKSKREPEKFKIPNFTRLNTRYKLLLINIKRRASQ